MVYRVVGVLHHSSGFAFSFSEFHENGGNWSYETIATGSLAGGEAGTAVNKFIIDNGLQYKVALIVVHSLSSTVSQGAVVAAATGLPVVSDLAALDIALGGNGEFLKNTAGKLGIDISTGMNVDINKATCIAFMGVLRWREEYNFLSSATGASRSSIGGAIWLGQEA